jgi:hypothetical protein
MKHDNRLPRAKASSLSLQNHCGIQFLFSRFRVKKRFVENKAMLATQIAFICHHKRPTRLRHLAAVASDIE